MTKDGAGVIAGSSSLRQLEPPGSRVELRLLDGFEFLRGGVPVALSLGVQRLIAFLALQERPVQRVYVAGKLWLEATDARAFANLRSTVWRAHRSAGPITIAASSSHLALAPEVAVDLRKTTARALRLVDGSADDDELGAGASALAGELLPDWYDDWVTIERERHRQLVLHALDALAARLTELGRFGEAAEAALAAIGGEPLRESAHRALLEVHLAEGNPSEALRHFEVYRELVEKRLAAAPSARVVDLVDRAHAALAAR